MFVRVVRTAVLAVVVCLSVCPSVCLSQVSVLPKRLNVGSSRVLNKAGVKRQLLDAVKARKLYSILWSYHEETRELPEERNNAKNNAKCTQARKSTHGLDRQHQDVDRTPCGRVNQNIRETTSMVWPTLGPRTAKEQNRGSRKQRHTIAQGFLFFDAENLGKIQTDSPNAGGVG